MQYPRFKSATFSISKEQDKFLWEQATTRFLSRSDIMREAIELLRKQKEKENVERIAKD